MTESPTTPRADEEAILKLVCKDIYSCIQCCSDDRWEDVWQLLTDDHRVKMGGEWEVVTAGRRIMRLLNG